MTKRPTERVTWWCDGRPVHAAQVGTWRSFNRGWAAAERACGGPVTAKLRDGTVIDGLRYLRPLGLGTYRWTRVMRARQLCEQVGHARKSRSVELLGLCKLLVESLSSFGREEPEARIRARACGCPL